MSLAANLGLVPRSNPAFLHLASLFAPANGSYAPYTGIGSRETPADVCADMGIIGAALEHRGFTLRSGGAGGADLSFERRGRGDPCAMEIYLPWRGFNNSASRFHPPYSTTTQFARAIWKNRRLFDPRSPLSSDHHGLAPIDIAARAYLIARAFHPKWTAVRPAGRKLHSRNVPQVLGMQLASPARFVLCWTKDGRATGGTGQALRIAEACGIRVLNLHNRALRAEILKVLR